MASNKATQSTTSSRRDTVEKLRDIIKDIDFCMLTTVDEDGTLRSRPMSTQDAEFDGDLWFFTYDDEGKAAEIRKAQQVNVSYADKGKMSFVSVSGTGVIVHDRAKMEQYWNPALEIWFPDGLETKGLALLKVTVTKAEYWESNGKVANILNMAKALLTNTEADLGENEKLTLK